MAAGMGMAARCHGLLYGYAPSRALAWRGAAFLVGYLYFDANRPAPVNLTAHPTFNPALYSADVLLPPFLGYRGTQRLEPPRG